MGLESTVSVGSPLGGSVLVGDVGFAVDSCAADVGTSADPGRGEDPGLSRGAVSKVTAPVTSAAAMVAIPVMIAAH
jgi:predicted tellurium resistance membrane protein TerC